MKGKQTRIGGKNRALLYASQLGTLGCADYVKEALPEKVYVAMVDLYDSVGAPPAPVRTGFEVHVFLPDDPDKHDAVGTCWCRPALLAVTSFGTPDETSDEASDPDLIHPLAYRTKHQTFLHHTVKQTLHNAVENMRCRTDG